MVPTTLTMASPTGSSTLARPSERAARCTTTSGRCRSTTASRPPRTTSARWNSKRPSPWARASSRLASVPVDRSSTATTRRPSASSRSTRVDPMKPAPPVTSTVRVRTVGLLSPRARLTSRPCPTVVAARQRRAGTAHGACSCRRSRMRSTSWGGAWSAQRVADDRTQLGLEVAASRAGQAVGQVRLEPIQLVLGQLAVHEQVELVEELVAVHDTTSRHGRAVGGGRLVSVRGNHPASSSSPRMPRSLAYSVNACCRPFLPRWIRDITVPTGVPMISAISL